VAMVDTRLRRLAYAPEIAADMFRRQQADAIVAPASGSSRVRWAWSTTR
jgi:hypothetical protein